MIRFRTLAVLAIVLLVSSLLPSIALAQLHTVKVFYYPAGVTLSGGSSATWNTGFWGVDYRLTIPSPWGVHLQYASGSQSGWTGAFGGATSGSDSNWFADATYRVPTPNAVVLGFIGYGSYSSSNNTTSRFTSSGFRLGAEGAFAIPGTRWQVNGSLAWYPSNSTSAGSSSASASATDWSISAQYNFPGQWLAELGYRSINAGTGVLSGYAGCSPTACNASSTGIYLTVGRTFP